jgi:transposase
MQKYLKLLNFRLDVVVEDVCGLDAAELAKHRHFNYRKSEEEIARRWKGTTEKIISWVKAGIWKLPVFSEEDSRMRRTNLWVPSKANQYGSFKKKLSTTVKTPKRQNKNAIKGIDLNQAAYQYFEGVDLMAIEGVSHATILSIMSEIGPGGFSEFPTSKHFTSWLRLAPNNKKTGGKIISNKVPKGSNRLKIALGNAANAVGNLKDTHLADFFKKVLYRKGRTSAVSATARKLAVIIWNMIVKKQPYNPPTEYLFLDQKRKMGLIKKIKKQIDKFEITGTDLGIATA